MLITETHLNSKISSVKRKKGVNKPAGSSAFSDVMSATSETSDVSETPAMSNIGGVLSLDSLSIFANLGNEEELKKQNIDWSKQMLNTLEGIKYQILNGKISYGTLKDLSQKLNNIPLTSADFRLKQIVDEIEVRAAVELEKYKKLSEETKLFLE